MTASEKKKARETAKTEIQGIEAWATMAYNETVYGNYLLALEHLSSVEKRLRDARAALEVAKEENGG